MSTTIQYKGNTLATVSNNTKTLKTAGKYMEGDVVLTDVSGGSEAISVVDTLDSHGGTIRTITAVDISDTTAQASDVASGKYFYTADGTKTAGTGSGGSANIQSLNVTQNGTYTASGNVDGYSPVTVNVSGGGGDTWSWMGKNPVKLNDYDIAKVYLKDSGYASWTPSTSATVIDNAYVLDPTTIDLDSYDYVIYMKFHSHLEYDSSATGSNQAEDYYYCNSIAVYGYCSNYNSMVSGNYSVYGNIEYSARKGLFYTNTSGVLTYASGINYGVYINALNSPSVDRTQVKPYVPSIYARCNNTYFSTGNASAVDLDKSFYEISIQIWRTDLTTSVSPANMREIRNMWINGF